MKKLLCLLLAALALLCAAAPAFAASAEAGGVTVADGDYYARFKGQGITLNVYNWGEYISDGSDDSVDTVAVFEELTGITVNYTNFATNEEMYAKIKSGGAQYDVIIPSDYMIARMASEGMLEELDYANIPNFALIGDGYKSLLYDPDDTYSVPYMWSLIGILYNTSMVDAEVDSWSILWDPTYMGNILMFSNSRDAFGVACLYLGYSLNTTDEDELADAAAALKEQKLLVQAYVQDEIYNKMIGGEAAVAPYYAGDALVMMDENPDLAFVYPKEGTNYFVDAMVIPAGCKNKEAAEAFLNFMCEPEVSAANAEYIGYGSPVSEVRDMLDLDEEVAAIQFPDEEYLAKTEVYEALPAATGRLMDAYWTEILSYNDSQNKWVGPVFLALTFGASVFIMVYRMLRKKRDAAR